MAYNLMARSPLEEGEYLYHDGLIIPHCFSTCANVASAWGSQKVMAISRYSAMAVVRAVRACSRWPVTA